MFLKILIPAILLFYIPTNVPTEKEAPIEEINNSITISFVGDCLMASGSKSSYEGSLAYYADNYTNDYFFKNVSEIFLNDDFTIANCENVFSDSENLTPASKGGSVAYWFKSKSRNAEIFKVSGIDFVSIINNHTKDYGTKGYEDTIQALNNANVLIGDKQVNYYDIKDKKVGIYCAPMYVESQAGNIKIKVQEMNEAGCDVKIVYFHGGTENIYQVEKWKERACREIIDCGADIVIGSHPHRIQRMEIYNGKTIVYSLGNFCFGGNNKPVKQTVIYQAKITFDDDINIENVIIPCYVYTGSTNNWQPAIIENETEKNIILDYMNGLRDLPY